MRKPGARPLTAAIVLLLAGAGVFVMSGDEPAPREALSQLSGPVRYVERVSGRGGGVSAVRFALAGDARHFHYLSRQGAAEEVLAALERAGRLPVRVLFDDRRPHSPWFDDRVRHVVYEVVVGDTRIRTYEQVSEAWRSDEAVGRGLAWAVLLAGVVSFGAAFRRR